MTALPAGASPHERDREDSLTGEYHACPTQIWWSGCFGNSRTHADRHRRRGMRKPLTATGRTAAGSARADRMPCPPALDPHRRPDAVDPGVDTASGQLICRHRHNTKTAMTLPQTAPADGRSLADRPERPADLPGEDRLVPYGRGRSTGSGGDRVAIVEINSGPSPHHARVPIPAARGSSRFT
jgi:hypothetical protein